MLNKICTLASILTCLLLLLYSINARFFHTAELFLVSDFYKITAY